MIATSFQLHYVLQGCPTIYSICVSKLLSVSVPPLQRKRTFLIMIIRLLFLALLLLPTGLSYAKGPALPGCDSCDFHVTTLDEPIDLVGNWLFTREDAPDNADTHLDDSNWKTIHTPGSWKKLMMSITNALNNGIRVQINTVMNHYNQDHLDKTVKFLVRHFPQIRHFVWNNLDPEMMRKTDTAWSTMPDYDKFWVSLKKAMEFLHAGGRTFRAEKVPLCYIRWFEWASTETRKIVKDEERIVHFLDFREMMHETEWWHEKDEACKTCDLNSICSGIYEREKYYSYVNVYPQKLTQQEKTQIIHTIK